MTNESVCAGGTVLGTGSRLSESCCRFCSRVNIRRRTCSASVDGFTKTSSSTQTAKTPKTGTTLSSGGNTNATLMLFFVFLFLLFTKEYSSYAVLIVINNNKYIIIIILIYSSVSSSTCRYRKGFELQPTLYSGINLTVLLIVAGQQFESSIELRKIGIPNLTSDV